jgi:hypothetical protein
MHAVIHDIDAVITALLIAKGPSQRAYVECGPAA